MDPQGIHIILDCYECDNQLLNDKKALKQILMDAAIKSGAHIVETSFHQFYPQGISGVIVISESHFSIHTWPEYKYAAIDIFTCSKEMNINFAIDYIIAHLKSNRYEIIRLDRGTKI